jgi:hypothetical protein
MYKIDRSSDVALNFLLFRGREISRCQFLVDFQVLVEEDAEDDPVKGGWLLFEEGADGVECEFGRRFIWIAFETKLDRFQRPVRHRNSPRLTVDTRRDARERNAPDTVFFGYLEAASVT